MKRSLFTFSLNDADVNHKKKCNYHHLQQIVRRMRNNRVLSFCRSITWIKSVPSSFDDRWSAAQLKMRWHRQCAGESFLPLSLMCSLRWHIVAGQILRLIMYCLPKMSLKLNTGINTRWAETFFITRSNQQSQARLLKLINPSQAKICLIKPAPTQVSRDNLHRWISERYGERKKRMLFVMKFQCLISF